MTAQEAPPTHEARDTGYSGDAAAEDCEFTRMSRTGRVPDPTRDRGRRPGTAPPRAP
jgi:hypothetical protein